MAQQNKYVYGDSICFFKNKYPIKGTIIPQYRLTSAQIEEVLTNVKYAFLNNLNAREVNFGEEINYDTIYSLIVNSDERIKSIMMDDITYKTYVTYLYIEKEEYVDANDDTQYLHKQPHFLDIRIDAKEPQLHTIEDLKLDYTCTVDSAPATSVSGFSLATFQTKTNFAHGNFSFLKTDDTWKLTISQSTYDVDDVNGYLNLSVYDDILLENYGISSDYYDDKTSILIKVKGFYDLPYTIYGVTYNSIYDYLRVLILTRSILAGKTPYFIRDTETPAQCINQKLGTLSKYDDVTSLKLTGELSEQSNPPANSKIFDVDKNTIVEFTSPNLITTDEYSSYVKYEYLINTAVNANSNYILNTNEYIAFYWSTGETSGNNYAVYGAGTIIQPTFKLSANTTDTLPNSLKTMLAQSGTNKITGPTYMLDDGSDVNAHIKSLENQGKVLSSTQQVSIKKQNDITITDSMYCSWVLSDEEDGYYVFFDIPTQAEKTAGIQERILKNGEYFMYTNQAKSSLVILGQGTKVTREVSDASTSWNSVWQCKVFDYSEIVSDGLKALINNEGSLVNIPSGKSVNAVEMQYIVIPSGGRVKIERTDGGTLPNKIEINGTIMGSGDVPYELDPSNCKVYYSNSSDDESWVELPLNIQSSGSSLNLGWHLNCIGIIDISVGNRFTLGELQSLNVKIDETTEVVDGDEHPYAVSTSAVYGEGEVDVDKIDMICYDTIDVVRVGNNSDSCISFSSDGLEANCLFDLSEYSSPHEVENSFTISVLPGNYVMRADLSSFDPISLYYWQVIVTAGSSAPVAFSCDYGKCTSICYHVDESYASSDGSVSVTITIKLTTTAEYLPSSGSYTLPITGYRLYNINSYVNTITGASSDSGRNPVIENTIDMLKGRCVSSPFDFDYSYVVDDNEIVRYPLIPSSFFNRNHIYNAYTIPMYDIDNFDDAVNGLFVTNKVR